MVNPFTGAVISGVGGFTGRPMSDIAIRTDGYMFGVQSAPAADQASNAGQLLNIHPGTAALTLVGQDDIVNADPTNPLPEQLTATTIDAMAYQRFDIFGQPGQGDGNTEHYLLYYSVRGPAGSVLYLANPTDGQAANDNAIWGPVSGDSATSRITGVAGFTTGMAFIGGTLFGVSDLGEFYSINTATGAATLIGPGFNMGFGGLERRTVQSGRRRAGQHSVRDYDRWICWLHRRGDVASWCRCSTTSTWTALPTRLSTPVSPARPAWRFRRWTSTRGTPPACGAAWAIRATASTPRTTTRAGRPGRHELLLGV